MTTLVLASAFSCEGTLAGTGSFVTPLSVTNPELNTFFDCRLGDPLEQGILKGTTSWHGTLFMSLITGATLTATGTLNGQGNTTEVVAASALSATGTLYPTSTAGIINSNVAVGVGKNKTLRWSKIGSLNFTIDQTNISGGRIVDFPGTCYSLIKLRNRVVLYGAEGVIVYSPKENVWAPERLLAHGTRGKQAQIGTDSMHWFIDIKGNFWELTNYDGMQITKIGYSEFFASLQSPVLSYDENLNLVYICDNVKGFVYSVEDKSLGSGPINVTGLGNRTGITYAVAPAAIVMPEVYFTTGIFDFGTRKEKTIYNVELPSYIATGLELAIEWRRSSHEGFVSTPWVAFTERGFAYLPCQGIEFKFKVRKVASKTLSIGSITDDGFNAQGRIYGDVLTSFSFDYMKINGQIHGFSFLDTVRKET